MNQNFTYQNTDGKVGAVMVLGGGVAGIQASLDLAEMGYKVYLVEQRPSIGGAMAQLDKTFPTNDCSMCLLSPKLVDTARHPNIEIITNADITGLEGEPGRFTATLRKRPRFVKEDKCTGCGECAEACTVEVQNEFDLGLGKRKAIYRLYPQAIPNTFTIQKKGIPPCRSSCPTGVNIQGFVALIRQKKYAEALSLYKEKNPFPGICGRICHHPCEDKCNRGEKLDEPIASKYLHRFLADLEMKGLLSTKGPAEEKNTAAKKCKGEKVAVVGSGPAGLTAAYDLAQMGYQPTVFEALPVAGGMLRVGIPRYRLPEEVIEFEIKDIINAGVEIKTSTPVGPDLTLNHIFENGYKAIFIAIGTHKSRLLNIEGEELKGVIHGVGFLQDVKVGKKQRLDGRVVAVIGGGNVAMDSVRTALRLGAKKAFVIYRRSKEEIPASESEIEEAYTEGVKIYYLAAPKRIIGKKGKVVGVECIRMKLGEPDETGRRRPIPIEGSEFIVEADVVIPAVSQSPDLSFLTDVNGLKVTEDGILPVEGVDLEGVYGFTDFLRDASHGHKIKIGPRVTVIGGGNVAIDVARTAVRLGGREIHLTCLEKRDEMPAFKNEVNEAEKEGVIIHNSLAPVKILGKNGTAEGVKFVECISVFDSGGKFNPKLKEDAESVIESETIIVAIGQVADYTLLKAADGILVTKADRIEVDDITYATNIRGVFAGGDVIGGPGLALSAIAQGHETAISIDRFLQGKDLSEGRVKREPVEISTTPDEAFELRPREVMPMLPVEERIRSFDEVDLGFTEEQVLAEANRCLNCSICSECLQCVDVCKAEAIDHEMQEQIFELNVGAVIAASGYDFYYPTNRLEYNYQRLANVVTSPEFERMLSASGPYEGHLVRPSDHKKLRRIAFLQCVGSRDLECNQYCSSVCCMHATKEAIVAKEHADVELDTDIYFMDMRAFGKGFDRYYERAKNEYNVSYRRCRLPVVEQADGSEELLLSYLDEQGSLKKERYDVVVLSTALIAPKNVNRFKEAANLDLNKYNFIDTKPFASEDTSREGVFVCGAVSEPKDIPETVIQASAAAGRASELLAEARGTLVEEKEYPPERDISTEPTRIGVFVCHCGINIGGVVDVEGVVEFIKDIPNVVHCEHSLYTCSQDNQQKIKETIKEHRLNRIVIASCTPRTHEPLFQDTIREVGLNPFLLEFVSIREHCSWVHMTDKIRATQKAKELVAMAVSKAGLLRPVHSPSFSVRSEAMVVGGGISGMTAALSLAEQGFEVHLVEKEKELGGNLQKLHFTISGDDPQELLRRTVEQVENCKKIHIHLGTSVEEFSGYMGNYKTTLVGTNGQAQKTVIEHGAVVIATGAAERETTEYLYGQSDRVITQKELEKKLSDETERATVTSAQTIAMIQCVGSREEEAMYCGRVCCTQAIKNALKIKQINPKTNVIIFYRDIRTYGFREQYYQDAREQGVIFVRYELENKPKVTSGQTPQDTLQIEAYDPVLGEKLCLAIDMLVLSTGIAPRADSESLAKIFKVPLDQDGFFLEAHIKLRPVDFATDGIYLCGLAHSPKFVSEAISQARAAAARAATLLAQETVQAKGRMAEVKERLCAGCGLCVGVCPYGAREIDQDKRIAKVIEVLCQGCGACAAVCPNAATKQVGFAKEEVLAAVDSLT